MDQRELEEKLETLPLTILAYGEEWVNMKEKADMLDETKKSLLSSIMSEIEGSMRGFSEAKLSRLALADDRYKAHLKAMCHAACLRDKAKVTYDSCRLMFEAIRSLTALERAKAEIR